MCWAKLLRLFILVNRQELHFSTLTQWADEYLLSFDYDEEVVELSLSETEITSLVCARNILENHLDEKLLPILENDFPRFLPSSIQLNQLSLLGKYEAQLEYQIGQILVYIVEMPKSLSSQDIINILNSILLEQNQIYQDLIEQYKRQIPNEWEYYNNADCLEFIFSVMSITIDMSRNHNTLLLQYNGCNDTLNYIHLVLDSDNKIILMFN